MFRVIVALSVFVFISVEASSFTKRLIEMSKRGKGAQPVMKSLREEKGVLATDPPTWGRLASFTDAECKVFDSSASIQFGVCGANDPDNGFSAKYTYGDATFITANVYQGTTCQGDANPTEMKVPGTTCTISSPPTKRDAALLAAGDIYQTSTFGTGPSYSAYNLIQYTSNDACLKGTAAEIYTVEGYPTLGFGGLSTECAAADVGFSKITSNTATSVTVSFYNNAECTGTATSTVTLESCSDTLNNGTIGLSLAVPSSSDSVCFAGSETVELENGEIKPISEVSVGDRVLAADMDGTTSFSTVVALAHLKNNEFASFVHIETESTDIKMTPAHLVMSSTDCVSPMTLTKAADVAVNSCLLTTSGPAKVTSSTVVVEAGIYSVVTEKELIVVNGVIASPFAVNHEIGHAYYGIHRTLMMLFPALLKSSLFENAHFAFSALVASF